MNASPRSVAVVTGASSGIGLELARLCAQRNFDLIIAADEAEIEDAAQELTAQGAEVTAVLADLATLEGVEAVCAAVDRLGRPVEALFANAGRGLGRGFLDQDFNDVLSVINTNITGTIYLVQRIAQDMLRRGEGRILFTGSIAGLMPGTFQAVYNGTKAFIDSFSVALRHELKNSGVSVTCLMPGPTDTEFFARADMLDTKVGQDENKADPAEVARTGFDAMMKGESTIVHGLKNKVEAALAAVTSEDTLAERHRRLAEPGSAPPSEP
ncbi:MAG TPA: SDR family NAD(P)-dependent oxidoreductase [Steroidobacteraceae bacterium]|jgi:short-subunit dehydrogenase